MRLFNFNKNQSFNVGQNPEDYQTIDPTLSEDFNAYSSFNSAFTPEQIDFVRKLKDKEIIEKAVDPLAFDIEQEVNRKKEKEDKIERLKQRYLETSPFKNVDERLANLHAEKQALELVNKQDPNLIKKQKEKEQLSRDKQFSEQRKSKIQEINLLRQESGLPLLDEETGQEKKESEEPVSSPKYDPSIGMPVTEDLSKKSYIEGRKRSALPKIEQTDPFQKETRAFGEKDFFISPQDYYENKVKDFSKEDIKDSLLRSPAAKGVSAQEKYSIINDIANVVGEEKAKDHLAFINKENPSFNRFTKNPSSSAEGLYQIQDAAYKDIQKLNPKFRDMPKSEMLKDPKLQAEAHETYKDDIKNFIKNVLKKEPTDELVAKIYNQGRVNNSAYKKAAEMGVTINGTPVTDDLPKADGTPGKTRLQKLEEQKRMGYDGPDAQSYWQDIQKNKETAGIEAGRQPSSEKFKNIPDSIKAAVFAKSNEEFNEAAKLAVQEGFKNREFAIDTDKRDELKTFLQNISELNKEFRSLPQEEQNAITYDKSEKLDPNTASSVSDSIKKVAGALRSENTVEALRAVQKEASQLRALNMIVQGFEKATRGLIETGGFKIQPGEKFTGFTEAAENLEAQFKQRAAMEGDDPNSEFSKQLVNFGNAVLEKIGVKDKPLTGLSGNHVNKILPIVKDLYEVDVKASYVKDQKERERSYKEELNADKEVERFQNNLSKPDSGTRSNLGKSKQIMNQVDRMLALTGPNGERISKLTGAEVLELIGGLDAIMNSQSTVAGREKLFKEYKTLYSLGTNVVRYLSNGPIPRGADEFVKLLFKTIKRERGISSDYLDNYYNKLLVGISDKTLHLRGEKINQIFDAWTNPYKYGESPSSLIEKNLNLKEGELEQIKKRVNPEGASFNVVSEEEKALTWAKQHINDPVHGKQAKEILKNYEVKSEKTPEQLKSEDDQALNWSKENLNNPKYAQAAFNILRYHGIV